jgi:hypothetical protein
VSTVSRATVLALLLAIGACSPTFNWRQWPVAGTPLQSMMPCKPVSATRPVPMLGTPLPLHMDSCEAGGLRFAIAWTDLGHTAQVPAALAAWRSASLQTLRATGSSPDDPALNWPVQVGGVTQVQGVQALGKDAQGQPVFARSAYFSRGSMVFQAAVYGARLDEETVTAFFSGLVLAAP